MIVIDTHVLVWALDDNSKLGKRTRALLDDQAVAPILIPAISVWEIAHLAKRDRLTLRIDVAQWIAQALELPTILLAPLEPAIALDSVMLPGEVHKDPADRMIIATARYHDAPLLTVDRAILAYGSAGHVQTIDGAL